MNEPMVSAVPESANFITLLNKYFGHTTWAGFLHHWENLVFSLLIVLILSVIAFLATRKQELIPTGLQNFLEAVIEYLDNFIGSMLGKEGRRYLPFVGTLFIYIFAMNLSGLIPGMKSPTSSLNTTVGLAACVFIYVQFIGMKRLGFLGYLDHMAGNPRMPKEKGSFKFFLLGLMIPIHILLFFIHIIGELVKPLSLSLRLFGNITGEDALLALFVTLGISALAFFKSPVGIPLQVPAMFLALVLGTVQAVVFSLLSTIYIAMMLPPQER